eukprot:347575-Chlamydomonas_euryale.AAC.1
MLCQQRSIPALVLRLACELLGLGRRQPLAARGVFDARRQARPAATVCVLAQEETAVEAPVR